MRQVWGFIPGSVKSDTVSLTARHRCDVSLELCSPGAKLSRWAAPLNSCFGVIPRVYLKFNFFIFFHGNNQEPKKACMLVMLQ